MTESWRKRVAWPLLAGWLFGCAPLDELPTPPKPGAQASGPAAAERAPREARVTPTEAPEPSTLPSVAPEPTPVPPEPTAEANAAPSPSPSPSALDPKPKSKRKHDSDPDEEWVWFVDGKD